MKSTSIGVFCVLLVMLATIIAYETTTEPMKDYFAVEGEHNKENDLNYKPSLSKNKNGKSNYVSKGNNGKTKYRAGLAVLTAGLSDGFKTIKPKQLKIFTQARGEFGNIMFDYASLYGLSRKNKRRPVLVMETDEQISDFRSLFPNIPMEIRDSVPKGLKKIEEKLPGVFDQALTGPYPKQDIEACCYLQSWKYFKDYEDEIRMGLEMNSMLTGRAQMYLTKLRDQWFKKTNSTDPTKEVIYVGIHIRRSEKADDSHYKRGWNIASKEYINHAMDLYRKHYGNNTLFVVCTDDLPWTMTAVLDNDDVALSVTESPILDLSLLIQCNHTIMTVGSYGWWASWLAAGETIYYKDHVQKDSFVGRMFKNEDYFPTSWIPMGNDGLTKEQEAYYDNLHKNKLETAGQTQLEIPTTKP